MLRRPPPPLLLALLGTLLTLVALAHGGADPRASAGPPPRGPQGSAPAALVLPAEPVLARDAPQPLSARARPRGAWRRAELRRLRPTRTVRGALRRAWVAGAITRADHDGWRSDLWAAERAARRLRGASGDGQRAALRIVRGLAARRALTSGRLPLAFLQLRRNTAWWTRHGPPGRDITWGEDPVTLRPVAGAGLVVHHLASWGRVNALAGTCAREPRECPKLRLRSALARMTALGARRSGALAWEHLFPFGGGRAGWVSAMVQGTAIQALARGGDVLGERRWVRSASRAAIAFERRPPAGVRVGRYYAMYSFDPSLRVVNGFLQTLLGLREMAVRHDSARARRLYLRGDRLARRMLAASDTGAWSLYASGGRENTLGYHRLTRSFLRALCSRTKRGAYCAARRRFARYEREPTDVAVRTTARRPRARSQVLVRFSVSKVSRVAVEVRGPSGALELQRVLQVGRGTHAVGWRPSRRGRHRVRVLAQGPSGPRGVARAAVSVRRSAAAVAAQRRREAAAKRRAERRTLERRRRADERERRARATGEAAPDAPPAGAPSPPAPAAD